MRNFGYQKAGDMDTALAVLAERPGARPLAGGAELVNLLKARIEAPDLLLDINALDLDEIRSGSTGLRIGALARMADVAGDPAVALGYPVIAQALEASASPQVRNAGTVAGNLMQRTRCPYFRAETELPCNKRRPGSGCAAAAGDDRASAIFGWSEHCRAVHPSDLAVALSALDSRIHVRSLRGERTIDIGDFYRLPAEQAAPDTDLSDDELITCIDVPASPAAATSRYLKVRERSSYEFALVSAAVAIAAQDGLIRTARIALGGVAPRPWRLRAAEQALVGTPLSAAAVRAAIEPSFADARPSHGNGFKIELAKRAAVRAVLLAGGGA